MKTWELQDGSHAGDAGAPDGSAGRRQGHSGQVHGEGEKLAAFLCPLSAVSQANDFDLRIISTGDVLRSEISKGEPADGAARSALISLFPVPGTEEGHAAAAVIKQGGLVSDDIMSAMLRRLLASETHSW